MRKKWLMIAGLILLAVPALAAAPKAVSILIDNAPFAGQALWYHDRVYVSLEDVARTLHATYTYDHATNRARVTLPAAAYAAAPAPAGHPYVVAAYKQQFTFSDNTKVVITFKNSGDATARNVEAICLFKDDRLEPINADLRVLGDMAPGDERSAEFYLYPSGGYASNYPVFPYYAGFGIVDNDRITIRGRLTSVRYDIRLNYPGGPTPDAR